MLLVANERGNRLGTPGAVHALQELARGILEAAKGRRDVKEAKEMLRKYSLVFGLTYPECAHHIIVRRRTQQTIDALMSDVPFANPPCFDFVLAQVQSGKLTFEGQLFKA